MRKAFIFMVAAALLAACSTPKNITYFQDTEQAEGAQIEALKNILLQPNDMISIIVNAKTAELSALFNLPYTAQRLGQNTNSFISGSSNAYVSGYTIAQDGTIDFPTIGKVYVLGNTTREVKHKLEQELSTLLKELPGYSTISVEVNIMNRSFSIIGAQSGRYSISKDKMTIFEALAMAGDLREFNSRKEIKLVREKNGVTTIKTFDVRSKDIVNSEFYYIEPNDIIYIRQIPGYSFGINHVTSVISVTAATISFGVFIYSIVQTGINHVNKHYGNKGEGGGQ